MLNLDESATYLLYINYIKLAKIFNKQTHKEAGYFVNDECSNFVEISDFCWLWFFVGLNMGLKMNPSWSLFFSTHWNLLLMSKCCCYVLQLLTTSSVICFPLLFFGFLDLSLFHTASTVSSASVLAVKDTSAPTLNQRKPTHRKHSSSTGIKNPGAPDIFIFPYTILLFFFFDCISSFPALWLLLLSSTVADTKFVGWFWEIYNHITPLGLKI